MTGPRVSETGFTLVELLVALAIFALISVAGVTLLRSGSDTQIAVKDRLEDLSLTNRLYNALEGDLAQAVARPVRGQDGQPVPAFAATDSANPDALVGFVRAGWSNFDEASRAGLQRVAYVLDADTLKRVSWPMLDGAAPTDAATLVENVSAAKLRFRDEKGEWRSDWTATDATALPRALELRLTRKGKPEQRMLFLVGPQTRIKPPAPNEEGRRLMAPKSSERGAALLSVLLMVAVLAVIAATTLDRLALSTKLSANGNALAQARMFSYAVESIAAARIEDLVARDAAQTTLEGGWLGKEQVLPIPVGTATATVRDGGNCFNLNSLVSKGRGQISVQRHRAGTICVDDGRSRHKRKCCAPGCGVGG